MKAFIDRLLKTALENGIEAAEVYQASSDSFRAMAHNGEVSDYSVSSASGLSLRGIYQGKMGYAATEAMDEEAIGQLIRGVKESAELVESNDPAEIYTVGDEYTETDTYAPALETVTEEQKLDLLLKLEKAALSTGDKRISNIGRVMVMTGSGRRMLVNTNGLDLSSRSNHAAAMLSVVARDEGRVATGGSFQTARDFSQLNAEKITAEAIEEALFYLYASPIASGSYRVIIDRRCMPDLLQTFCGVFSADMAQKGLSLLKDKEGEMIAAPCVTLMDDPHMKDGFGTDSFDAEGVATKVKAVIENGRLTTLLHNLKTARKAGVASTGNAGKAGYAAPVDIRPYNFYFKPGTKTLEEMMADIGNGVVITEVSGLHAGANPLSGDFSLLSKGYTVENGKKGHAVEQITLAGNFYTMLKNIRCVGSDLEFVGSPFGSPSVDVGEMVIAGK